MNPLEQPLNNNEGQKHPFPFSDAVYDDIFKSAPKPTAEQLAASDAQREALEKSFAGGHQEIAKNLAQEVRSKDMIAANEILKDIQKAA